MSYTPKHSENESKKSKKTLWIILILLLLLLLIAFGIFAVKYWFADTPGSSSGDADSAEEVPNENNIAIPGYEAITLTADTTEQTIAFDNPASNNCYFVITLYLEDGTQLWQSDYIKPGKASDPVVLTQPLAEGTYANAVLDYSCYTYDRNKSPLNGAETKLTLRVVQ